MELYNYRTEHGYRISEKDKCSMYFLYVIAQKGLDVYNTMNLDNSNMTKSFVY